MDYKNEVVGVIMSAMLGNLAEFNNRRKAGQWKGIIFALGEVFPEDKAAMIGAAFAKPEPEARTTKAKITRTKPVTASKGKPPCPDCPGAVFGRTGTAAGSNTPPPRVARRSKAEQEEEATAQWETIDDIMQAFESSSEAMTAYCQAKQVKLPGNIKDAAKIAGYILDHEKAAQ